MPAWNCGPNGSATARRTDAKETPKGRIPAEAQGRKGEKPMVGHKDHKEHKKIQCGGRFGLPSRPAIMGWAFVAQTALSAVSPTASRLDVGRQISVLPFAKTIVLFRRRVCRLATCDTAGWQPALRLRFRVSGRTDGSTVRGGGGRCSIARSILRDLRGLM